MLRLPQARQTYYRWETLISSVAGLLHWESGPEVGAMAPSIHKCFVTMRTEPEIAGLERRKEQRSCNDNAPFSLVSLPHGSSCNARETRQSVKALLYQESKLFSSRIFSQRACLPVDYVGLPGIPDLTCSSRCKRKSKGRPGW